LLCGIRPAPSSPLLPYTTLFRSFIADPCATTLSGIEFIPAVVAGMFPIPRPALRKAFKIKIVQNDVERVLNPRTNVNPPRINNRSEEHTSELQSRFDLVCRLLLE